MTDAKRQEFILLSDTLGVSMLTVAQNHAQPAGVTESTVFGPFHVEDAPRCEQGADIAAGAPGEPLDVGATSAAATARRSPARRSTSGRPTQDGFYDVQYAGLRRAAARAACCSTDAEGRLRFRGVAAGRLPGARPTARSATCCVASGRHPWRPGAHALHDPGAGLRDADHARVPRRRPLPRQRRRVRRARVARSATTGRMPPAPARMRATSTAPTTRSTSASCCSAGPNPRPRQAERLARESSGTFPA